MLDSLGACHVETLARVSSYPVLSFKGFAEEE